MRGNDYFISSWSGGKDSCLACYYAMQQGLKPHALLNMAVANPDPLLKIEVVRQQSLALNIPIHIQETTWNEYEQHFFTTLKSAINERVSTCVFGDIDLEQHKAWEEMICQKVNLKPLLPLWQKGREELLNDFIELGFKATIVVVDRRHLDESFLGREIDYNLLNDLKKTNIDLCGEEGEYHTIVTDGPIFSYPLVIRELGIKSNGYYGCLNFDVGF